MPEVKYREASKVQILEAPRMPPGKCCICGSSNNEDRQYCDMGWEIDFFGVVYICTFCFSEVANLLGCLTPEQAEALELENERLRQEIVSFRAKELAINDAADKLRASGLFDFASVSDGNGAGTSRSPGAQTLTEFYDNLQHTSNESSGSSEQDNSEQGRDDISSSKSVSEFDF